MSDADPNFGNVNPYAPTGYEPELVQTAGVEAIRKQFISHEASLKSIGTLYILGAVLTVPIGAFVLITALAELANGTGGAVEVALAAIIGAIFLALSFGQGLTGFALSRLKPWSRIVAIVLSAIGLIGIPIGTIISAYFLYLLLSKKGSYVFSDEYQQVIAQTPHIKYRTSIIVWIFFGLLLGLFALLIAGALLGDRG